MARKTKKRFKFDEKADLIAGSSGKEVDALQAMLSSFGYLRGAYEPGKLCSQTERAVRRYQRFYKLKTDGVVGSITKRSLEMPRCGVPDIPLMPAGAGASPFVLRGCSYEKRLLSYAFLNETTDLSVQRQQQIVREAFGVWSGVANIRFKEVTPDSTPDFRVAFRAGNHGDGSSFDGPSNTLAHAFFPPPCGGPNAGDLHFDEAEKWIDDPTGEGILLRQVAIHEIGHLLGLSHSDDEAAIMFAYYAPDRVNLAQDDINGIQALYGAPSTNQPLELTANTGGSLTRAGEEQHFELRLPQNFAISIDGPDDADFDLYIRRGQPPTTDEWDFRAFTSSADESIILPAEAGTQYFVMVRSYEGSGEYRLKVEPSGSSG